MKEKILKYHLLLFFCTSFMYHVNGQLTFNRYTTDEGLPHDITYEIIQDERGYIYIGTEIGLAKFDGDEFSLYTSLDNQPIGIVTSFAQLSKDSLLLGTWGRGVKIIDYSGNSLIQTVGTTKDDLKIKSLTEVKGNLFSSLYYALVQFKINKKNKIDIDFYTLKENKETYSLNFEPIIKNINPEVRFYNTSFDGKLYYLYEPKQSILATNQFKGVYYSKPDLDDKMTLTPDFPILKSKYISSLQNIDDAILAGTRDTIFYISQNHNEILKTIPLDLNGNYVLKIAPFSKEEFVFTTINNKGIKYVYLYDHGKLTNLNKVLGLKNSVSDIMIDNEENIWVTSYGDGIFHIPYRQKQFTYLDKKIFSDPNILQISNGQLGEILLMATDYLYKVNYSGELLRKYNVRNECNNVKIFNGKLVALCANPELKSFSTNVLEIDGLHNNVFEGIGEVNLKDKSLWVNDRKVDIEFESEIQMHSMTPGKNYGELWLTDSYSLYLIDYLRSQIISEINISSNFCGTRINKLYNYQDTLWVGTDRCLNYVVNNKVNKLDLEYDNNVCIYDIEKDTRGILWVATHLGLFYKDKIDIKRMTQYTGLLSDYCKSLFIDPDGKVWVSGNSGVTIFDPKNLEDNTAPKFNLEQNNCKFNIRTITFNRSKSVEVQYKLSSSKKWHLVVKNTVDFCDLKPNKYSVHFRFRKSDSNWQYSPAYAFYIELPWYESWWGISTLVFMVLGLFISLVLFRLRNINRRNKVLNQLITEKIALEEQLTNARNNIAMDFHDDMGNKMARISILSEMLASDSTVTEDHVKSKLNQIKDDANVLYKNTKDFIWALKSDSNLLSELITYISDFGEDLFYNLDIEFDIVTDYEEDLILPFHWNRHLVLICKEVMTNASKHAFCKNFTFEVKLKDNILLIVLKDNGLGMNLNHLKSTSGLSHIAKRMKTIDGDLKIESRPNMGTTVILSMIIQKSNHEDL